MLTLAYGGEGGDQPKYYMLTEGGSQANAYTSKVLHNSPYDGTR